MKCLFKQMQNQDGTVTVLVALLLVALMGCVALVVDFGVMYSNKSNLQNVADAAALAGAQDLTNTTAAKITARNYAQLNGVAAANTIVNAPYEGDSTKIEVICTRNVPFLFARVFGMTDADVSARAVAQKEQWNGEALPFINLDDKYGAEGTILQAWEKVDPGDKERIHNDDLIVSPDNTSIKVKYEDGSIMFKKGKDNSLNAALNNILVVGRTVYLFSLSNEVIDSGDYKKKGPKELKNKDLIPLEDTVLLECEIVKCEGKLVTLKLIKVYDLSAGVYPKSGPPKLIE
ncbi:MAG: pilus assembly protein TadG-related protein [Syntrophomonadaceae bacterium]|jgi:hypothetical protein